MTLLCISNESQTKTVKSITIGKIYQIFPIRNIDPFDINTKQYCIIDDSGFPRWYNKKYFVFLSEMRDQKLKDIGI